MQIKERVFALDIGDLFLKFALCKKEENSLRAVLWGMEELNILFWHRPFERVWKFIEESYIKAQVAVSFSPSFLKTRLGTYLSLRKNPKEKLHEKEYNVLLKEVEEYGKNSFSKELALKLKVLQEDLVLKDIRIFQWSIDGYPVKNPTGFEGSQVKAEFMAHFLFKSYDEVVKAIPRKYKLEQPLVYPEVEGLLQFAFEKNQEGIFLDIGDKTTQLVVIKKERVLAIDELPFGGENMTRLLMDKLGMKVGSARELKEQYAKQMLSQELMLQLRHLFLPEVKNFVTLLKEKLGGFNILLPNHLILFGGGALMKEITEELEKENFTAIPFQGEVAVSLLFPKDMWEISNMNQVSNPQYTSLFLQFYAFQSHAQNS